MKTKSKVIICLASVGLIMIITNPPLRSFKEVLPGELNMDPATYRAVVTASKEADYIFFSTYRYKSCMPDDARSGKYLGILNNFYQLDKNRK
jgi:hypothetical protein